MTRRLEAWQCLWISSHHCGSTIHAKQHLCGPGNVSRHMHDCSTYPPHAKQSNPCCSELFLCQRQQPESAQAFVGKQAKRGRCGGSVQRYAGTNSHQTPFLHECCSCKTADIYPVVVPTYNSYSNARWCPDKPIPSVTSILVLSKSTIHEGTAAVASTCRTVRDKHAH
eukprot:scaffold67265_cov21-Tisochrysis_lutea.AAC.1